MSAISRPFNFKKWIDANRSLLQPPIGNKVLWQDHEFIVMVVGGPNARTDFHVNQSEEFFYQLEGDMILKVVNSEGQIEDVLIQAGDVFLLPGRTPHSPQRPEHSVGLVVERRRREGELDALRWYCERCSNLLYEETFFLTNIETQFGAVFERYYNSKHGHCQKCRHSNGRKWNAQN